MISETSLILSVQKLLDVLKVSKSPIILTIIAEIYAISTFDKKTLDVEGCLKYYISKKSPGKQTKSLELIYTMCESNFSINQRYTLATDFYYPLLLHCSSTAIEKFCVQHIKNTLDTFGIEDYTAANILQKIVGFLLIDALFFKLNFDGETCAIADAAFEEKGISGKGFIKKIMTLTLATCKKKITLVEPDIKEMFRLYQCSVYKALVSIISNTQRDPKFYVLLFTRKENEQDVLWKQLINLDKKYNFEQDFDSLPTWKSKFANIRNEVRDKKRKRGIASATVRYVESQQLFNSTLSEDVSKFDFTNTTLRNESEQEENLENKETFCQQEVELESVEINNHECMATICGLIKYIVQNDISPLPKPDEQATELPEWMLAIRKVLMSDSTHVNVKIFLIKIIENTKPIFACYAKWFYEPLIKFIIDGCAGNCINFFTYDLVSEQDYFKKYYSVSSSFIF